MSLIVQKYGGAALATLEQIKKIAQLVVETKKRYGQIIVVVSAMGNKTDELFELAQAVSPHPPQRELDMLLTAGERISMALLSMAINNLGWPAISFTGSQSGILTDSAHTRAKILDVKAFRIREELVKGNIVVVAGFQGVSREKEVTTLGRGGSDTTAVALAAALGAELCEFRKDVDGFYTSDPKKDKAACKILSCHYDKVLEIISQGAKILHSPAVMLAKQFRVPLHICSAFSGDKGTFVGDKEHLERYHQGKFFL